MRTSETLKKLTLLFAAVAVFTAALICGCARSGKDAGTTGPVTVTEAGDSETQGKETMGRETTGGPATDAGTEAPPEVFTEPMNVDTAFTYSYDKLGQSDALPAKEDGRICLAGGEAEAITLVVRTDRDRTVGVEPPTLTDRDGHTLTAKEVDSLLYVEVRAGTGGFHPDVVMPPKKGKLDLKAGVNNLIYILFETTEDTPAGEYTGVVRLTGDGEFKEVPLTVKVWDFVLPETPTCRTAFGVYDSHLYTKYGVQYGSVEAKETLMKANYFLLDHKVSSLTLPFDVLSDEFDEYMRDERVTSVRIPYAEKDDTRMQAIMDKLDESDEWYDKSLFYLVDEPGDEAAYGKVKAYTNAIQKYTDRQVHQIVPVSTMNVRNSMQSKTMQAGCTVWCPISGTFGKSFVTDFLETRRELGQQVWWYCCRGIDDPLCNIYQINAPGLNNRSYFWQMYDYKVEGLLYWSICYWSFEPDDADPWTQHIMPGEMGDGSLIYSAYNRIYSSLRLEIIRDGIEDYEYLTMAEALFGREKVDEIVDSVTTSIDHYNKDNDLFAAIREKLGEAIESGKL